MFDFIEQSEGCGYEDCCCRNQPPVDDQEQAAILNEKGGTFDDYFIRTNAGVFLKHGTPIVRDGMVYKFCILMKKGLCTVHEKGLPAVCAKHVCGNPNCTKCKKP